MATINASTSGVGGVITTADATGILDLQTANVTRASVSSSGLKISRVDSSNEGGQLDLCRSSDNTSAWAIDVFGNTSTPSLRFVDNVAASDRMVVDGSGNVGIGTASPNANLEISGTGNREIRITSTSGGDPILGMWVPGTTFTFFKVERSTGNLIISDGTERVRMNGANFMFNSGYGSVATAYGCRAWVNFNGEGTVAIRASANVSSITDNGVGNYRVNFTTSMPDANYSVGFGASGAGSIVSDTIGGPYTYTTSSFLVNTRGGNNAQADRSIISCVIIR